VARYVLVTPYYLPEIAASVVLMANLTEDLAAAGHEVTVLTLAARGSHGGAADAGGNPRILRMRNPFSRRPGVLARALEYGAFGAWVIGRLLARRDLDVCFVSSNPPLMGWPLAWLGRMLGFPVIYNLQDLFPESAIVAGLLRRNGLPAVVAQSFEKRTYRSVRLVIAISENFADRVRSLAPSAAVEVIPNWIDTEFMKPIPAEQNGFLKETGLPGRVVALHAGNMGYLQDLETLLAAADRLSDSPELAFALVGGGGRRASLVSEAGRRGLANCFFFDFQPHQRLPEVYSAGDIGLVTTKRGAGGSSVPSKTWSIMACARPVVAAVDRDSALAIAVNESGGGIVVEPESPELLADVLRDLSRRPDRRQELGDAGRRYVLEHLSRKTITARYEAAFRSVSARR
jgi:colanic acid biosynthesis glycosyl transferase WcaI